VDDSAIIATSRQPALLVTYLETYLGVLERCLRERGIAFNFSKSIAMLFIKTVRRIHSPRPIKVETARYIGVTLDEWLGWSTQSGTETQNDGTSPEQEGWSVHQEWSSAV
jgi:hypothetical protein